MLLLSYVVQAHEIVVLKDIEKMLKPFPNVTVEIKQKIQKIQKVERGWFLDSQKSI